METVNSQHNRVLAALGLLVFTGWAWSLSNVAIPDVLWLLNAALTLVFIAMATFVLVRRAQRR